jgi:anti-anti-sigma factor
VGDHLCWVYDDDAAFDAAVQEFLSRGLARGERLLCVGERVIDSVRAGNTAIDDVDALIADGRLELLTVSQAYAAAGSFGPEPQRDFYESATQRAIAAGFRGLRVVAEITPLAADAGSRADLLRWEHLADEYMAQGAGMSAMCAYRSDLPAVALTDVASAHPLVRAAEGIPAFRLFFDGGRLALAGSVDTFDADRLAALLATSPVHGPEVTLDLTSLDYIDGAGCRVLARWARDLRSRSIGLVLHRAPGLVQRMWSILGYTELAPVSFGHPRA